MRAPYRQRRINRPPQFNHFKPAGVPARTLETIIVTVDEHEALRLADYLNLEHQEASQQMNISRPTFTRLIEKARQKIARALMEGLQVVIEGGNINYVNDLSKCLDCGDVNEHPIDLPVNKCPDCGSKNIDHFAERQQKGTQGSDKK